MWNFWPSGQGGSTAPREAGYDGELFEIGAQG
jgi:hypothetical protein